MFMELKFSIVVFMVSLFYFLFKSLLLLKMLPYEGSLGGSDKMLYSITVVVNSKVHAWLKSKNCTKSEFYYMYTSTNQQTNPPNRKINPPECESN